MRTGLSRHTYSLDRKTVETYWQQGSRQIYQGKAHITEDPSKESEEAETLPDIAPHSVKLWVPHYYNISKNQSHQHEREM